jgi:hypothetical protein
VMQREKRVEFKTSTSGLWVTFSVQFIILCYVFRSPSSKRN